MVQRRQLSITNPPKSSRQDRCSIDVSVLTQLADQYSHPITIKLLGDYNGLDGVASGLNKGFIRVIGGLGEDTADFMTGGALAVKGNVGLISNVHDGFIYVDGNVDCLINIHEPARVFVKGAIRDHVFLPALGQPSSQIYCLYPPRKIHSYDPAQIPVLSEIYGEQFVNNGWSFKINDGVSLELAPSRLPMTIGSLERFFAKVRKTS